MDILILILKAVSVIYAIVFYLDLIGDRKWVFGWGNPFPFMDNFIIWIENHKIFGLKIAYFIFMIPMVPLVVLYSLHPLLLLNWLGSF